MLNLVKAVVVFVLASAVSEVSVATTNAVQRSSGLVWDMYPSKMDLVPGEPVLLILDIKNLLEEDAGISFGSEGISAFSIEIRDVSGRVIRKGGRISRAGISSVEYRRVPREGQVEKRIVLNQWVSTLLPAGKYMVVCRVQPELSADPRVSLLIELSCQIEILASNGKALEGIFRDVLIKSQKAKTPHERDMAARMLAFSDSPLAPGYQMLVVQDRSLPFETRNLAVEGMGRVGTTEAALNLAKLAAEPLLESYLHDTAVIAIYDYPWGDDPKLQRGIDVARKIWRRPIRPKEQSWNSSFDVAPLFGVDEGAWPSNAWRQTGPSRHSTEVKR